MSDSLFETTFRVGEILHAEPFPETRKPEMAKLEVDLGDETVQSAAQTGYNYDPDDLVGRQVLCATNLGTVNIAGYESEALTVGVPDEDGHPVLVAPDDAVPLGGELY
ncbi:tRNA-binding protein [Halocalculus aciditolerans]|uniref:tRNA-binding protein n=1 Tax=Halocalculus aciditolerans TaxID=1383812 RepID=A0A830FK54_9EURY|nr:tRNA-binding protein [Halocalculus aciditolerans]GGL63853.1 tRNA-binding protein [Halocalculus aciditolerans]